MFSHRHLCWSVFQRLWPLGLTAEWPLPGSLPRISDGIPSGRRSAAGKAGIQPCGHLPPPDLALCGPRGPTLWDPLQARPQQLCFEGLRVGGWGGGRQGRGGCAGSLVSHQPWCLQGLSYSPRTPFLPPPSSTFPLFSLSFLDLLPSRSSSLLVFALNPRTLQFHGDIPLSLLPPLACGSETQGLPTGHR